MSNQVLLPKKDNENESKTKSCRKNLIFEECRKLLVEKAST